MSGIDGTSRSETVGIAVDCRIGMGEYDLICILSSPDVEHIICTCFSSCECNLIHKRLQIQGICHVSKFQCKNESTKNSIPSPKSTNAISKTGFGKPGRSEVGEYAESPDCKGTAIGTGKG